MMTHRSRAFLVLAAALGLAACGRESPTAVGTTLLPAGGVRTFELILDAPDFLVSDTAASGFVFPINASFEIVAESYGDSVSAHVLGRFVTPSVTISVRDTATNSATTDTARYVNGRVVLYVDSTASNPQPVDLQLYRTTQQWDALTASWTMAVDSGSTHVPWTQAGGTVGTLVSSAHYAPGDDSVVFSVDSATIVAWGDTLNPARGALIRAVSAGTRLRATSMGYFVNAHGKKVRPDTTVTVTPGLLGATFIYTPQAPRRAGTLQLGGVPAWRSFLTFNPAMATRSFTCPANLGSCTYTLRDVTINYAALLLQPLPSGAFAPEDSIRPSSWVLSSATTLPLIRTPLGAHVGTVEPAFAPSAFIGSNLARVAVPITGFVATLAGDTATAVGKGLTSNTMALEQAPEPSLFGVVAFGGRNSGATAPKLRLIITLGSEVQLP
ncbi:MAG TPA: hypothetical protein VF832_01230 [Longimicrobiales bacterium]